MYSPRALRDKMAASTSRTPPFSVNRPSPCRDHRVWPEPLVPRSSHRPVCVLKLREQESATIAKVGIVKRETGGHDSASPAAAADCRGATQTFAKCLNPGRVTSFAEPYFFSPARVAKAQHRLWKRRGLCCICEEGRYLLNRNGHTGV